ncbi:GNAT acetyltransferase, mec-17 domain-containing protein [Ditylenchus destructor]|nr:GNAT acetyltransferase, mec-17 domain-containing protein [Ditylenchus destructor]
MEISSDLSTTLKEPVHIFDRNTVKWLNPVRNISVGKAIDEMGKLSAQAQSLKKPLTTFEKLLYCEDEQTLYLMWKRHDTRPSASIVIGYLKTTKRQLYLKDTEDNNYVTTPLCVLDFFVHPSMQKQGYAEVIFNHMLEHEKIEPINCAFDKPSAALLEFLRKHHKLESPIWQVNNFAVFPNFFVNLKSEESKINGQSERPQTASTFGSVTSRSTQRDSVGGIFHRDHAVESKNPVAADSPQGRKNTRDFGHQPIW